MNSFTEVINCNFLSHNIDKFNTDYVYFLVNDKNMDKYIEKGINYSFFQGREGLILKIKRKNIKDKIYSILKNDCNYKLFLSFKEYNYMGNNGYYPILYDIIV